MRVKALDHACEGVTVVAMATNIPGPLTASRLHAMGAAVLKIEPPGGDALAAACPQWYRELCRGIDVRRLDLRAQADLAVLHAELSRADLLITTMRASALDRIGLDWESLHARYPRLSHVAIAGEAPPHADRAGHDLTYQARAGLLSPPAMPRSVFADLIAAERACAAALAALLSQRSSGRGVRADVAILAAAGELALPLRYGLTTPCGVLGGALAAYALYPAADGWIALAALEEHFRARVRDVLGVDALDADALRACFASASMAHWEAIADAHDIPLAAVRAQHT
jgi:alpha-methylacyl-CoA racemase